MAFDLDDEEYEATRKLNGVEVEEDKEIQVGEYVRAVDGFIAKVEKVTNNTIICNNGYISKKDITKHSKDIIDIIEVGDILTYKLGTLNSVGFGEVIKWHDPRSDKEHLLINGYGLEQINIISIVTKKQFEQISYRVGDGK